MVVGGTGDVVGFVDIGAGVVLFLIGEGIGKGLVCAVVILVLNVTTADPSLLIGVALVLAQC